ncbi:unnamed protein product [Linum tenue]|uniref:CCT domain-containing protein n=1 Tax=Linum tenue TaxID=586396 RepID=A0AAV0JX81_9ROSI|nr:unnamed protein product [Linum tenue]
MSSDLFVLDDSAFFHHSSHSPEMVSSDGAADLFFSDQLCSTFDVFPELNDPAHDPFTTADSNGTAFGPTEAEAVAAAALLCSSSPPSRQLEGLTIGYNGHHLAPGNGYGGDFYSGLELEVKTEECHVGLEGFVTMPRNYGGAVNDDVEKVMQRSYSGNSFDDDGGGGGSRGAGGFFFQPRFDTVLESQSYQQPLSSPESNFFAGQLRRVCSTGDLQNMRRGKATQRSLSSPLATESSFTEESQFKVGRYSAEERKERISKYRAKRSQRNFTKTIKYACRKTLADNRPRIRGRFARNDESYCEIPKPAASSSTTTRDEDEDDQHWFDGFHGGEEEEDGGNNRRVGGCYGEQAQFHYYGY